MNDLREWKSERANICESDDESYTHSSNNHFSSDLQERNNLGTNGGDENAIMMGEDETCGKDEDVGVYLNSYDSDLNIIIEEEGTLGIPLSSKDLQHLCAGVRTTYGFNTGRIYYEVKLDFRKLPSYDSGLNPYEFRIGWSSLNSSLILGEEVLSFGFANLGLIFSNGESKSYGSPIHSGDVVGALLDMDSDPVVLSYTVNGIPVGIAFKVSHLDLEGAALFPHVLTRNVIFKCNFHCKFPWFKPPSGYVYVGDTLPGERVAGPAQPESDVREIILVCGLPKSGKSTWIKKFCEENIHKYYTLDCSKQIIKQQGYEIDWTLIRKCEKKLRKVCARRNQKFIFEEDTLSHTTQREMMTCFRDFTRQAVIIVPSDKEYDRRFKECKHLKSLDHFYVEYMKAKFLLPAMGIFDLIVYPELPEDQAHMSISRYNEEGDRYTSCRGKHPKPPGKNKSKLINSLRKGGTYDVDLSSSSSEAESVSEEINIIISSCTLRRSGRSVNCFESSKPSEPVQNDNPPTTFAKKIRGILKRGNCPRNDDQKAEERQLNQADDQHVNGSECLENRNIPSTAYQQDTEQTQELCQQDTRLIPTERHLDANQIAIKSQNINNTNKVSSGYQQNSSSVPRSFESIEYPRNAETTNTRQENILKSQLSRNLPRTFNIREREEISRYPIKNTQIAVYNFSDCRVGLTHEGLASTHANSFGRDNQLQSDNSTQSMRSYSGRYVNGGNTSQHRYRGQHSYNNRRGYYNEVRPHYRSIYHKDGEEEENNFNRLGRPFYHNRHQNWGQNTNMSRRSELSGIYDHTNISASYGFGHTDPGLYDRPTRSQHYNERYPYIGPRERYAYNGYYWSHF